MSVDKLYCFCFLALLLNKAVAQQPRLVVPVGHAAYVTMTRFSPDGRSVATIADDKTVKIWDPATGRLLQTLYGHTSIITDMEFSSKGNYLHTGSFKDSSNRVWDLHSGKESLRLKRVFFPDKQVRFSKDEKYAVALNEKWIGIWNIITGKQTDSFGAKARDGLYRFFSSAALSNDGKWIAGYTLSNDSIFIWNVATHRLVKKIYMKTGYGIRQFSFSPDDQLIYISTTGEMIAVNVNTGKIKYTSGTYSTGLMEPKMSRDGRYLYTAGYEQPYRIENKDTVMSAESEKDIYQPAVIDLLANKITKLKSETPPGYIKRVCFDDQGKFAAVVSTAGIYIYKAGGGKLIQQCLIPIESEDGNLYNQVDLSPGGKFAVVSNYNKAPAVFDIKGNLLYTLTGSIAYDKDPYFSNDGDYIFTSTGNQKKFSWDVRAGKMGSRYDTMGDRQESRPVKKGISHVIHDTIARQWKIVIEKDTVALQGQISDYLRAILSHSGNYIITHYTGDSLVKIWDSKTGQLVNQVHSSYGEFSEPLLSNDDRFIALLVSNTSSQLDLMWDNLQKEMNNDTSASKTIGDFPNEIKVLAFPSCKPLLYLQDTSGLAAGRHVSFSDSSRYFSFAGDQFGIWDTNSWQQILSVNNHCDGVDPSWAISPDGKMILVFCNNNASLFESRSNKLLIVLPGSVNFADFSSDGKRILTQSDDQQLKIWNIATGELLYTYYAFENGNYIVTDNFDRYDGTEEARKKLYYVCGNEFIDLDQFKDQLWVPNLAERIMNGDTINAARLSDLDICGLTPEVEDAGTGATEYFFRIKPRRGGLGETVLYVNGIEARRYKPEQLRKNGTTYELRLKKNELKDFLVAGKENPVTVKAYTSNNTISSRGLVINEDNSKQRAAPPNLYAVMIGISDYKGDELDLKYAAKDATDISKAVSSSAKKLLNIDSTEHVFMYNFTTAKDHYQLPEKNGIKKILEEIGRKATANDILLIFFAGHGIMEGTKKQFYFLTADASPSSALEAIADVGISTAELSEWMKPQNIKAQKRILIFDACNSGQAINDFVKLGKEDQGYVSARNDDKSQQIKAIDKLNEKSGLFILSAAASNQSAYEMGKYAQGLLTYSLLKAIKEQPDILEDGKYLNVSRWFNAAEKTVSDLSKESGARQEPQIVTNTNFNIGVVDEEVMAKIVLPQEKPLFAASNFQNNDETIADDDLELSKLINQQLNDMAIRGAESKIIYTTTTNSPDAYSLGGRYLVKDDSVTVTINIRQNKVVKSKFELTGKKDKLSELAAEIVHRAVGMLE